MTVDLGHPNQPGGKTWASGDSMTTNALSRNCSTSWLPAMTQHEPGPMATEQKHDCDVRHERSIEVELVALMDRYETPIYNYLLSILRDRDLALDCAQDTFLRAYEALRKRKGINGSWLYTVARHRAVDEFRRNRHVLPDEERIRDALMEEGAAESTLEVWSVMDRLPPMDREVLYLFEIAGFKTGEIGAMLGIRGSAVRQRLMRARQRFRALYSGEPGKTNKPETTYM